MRGRTIILRGPSQREYAHRLIDAAPNDAVVNVREASRSNEQNAKMWAMLGDIVTARIEGRRWTAETWKCAFMHSLGWQVKFCESLDGGEPFPVGYRSSRLNKAQMSDLIECVYEYGERHGVRWTDPTVIRLEQAYGRIG